MQVDGFRFDLAPVLGREQHGFDQGSGFFDALMQDPVLAGIKFIAEPWDIAVGATSGQVTRAMLIEAGFLGLCAVTAGIALGTLQCVIFLKTLLAAHTGWHLDMVFPWQGALRTAAIVIVTSAVARALPALRTARSPDTLRPGVTE
jgi:hypothetical protein